MSLVIPAATNRSLGSFLGGVIGGIGGFIQGGTGGVVGGINTGAQIGGALQGAAGGTPPPAGNTGAAAAGGSGAAGGPPPGCSLTDYLMFRCPTNVAGGPAGTASGPGTSSSCGCGYKGYHLNKSVLGPTRGGCGRTARAGWTAKHMIPVRNRHIHYGNTRAARRAIHRLKGAHRIFKQIDKIVGRRSSRRPAPFRRRR